MSVCARVCTCVYRPELGAGTFGPEAPAVTPQDSAVPATADSQRSSAQTLFLANFSFSPLLLRPLPLRQIKCSSRRKTEAKGKERSSNADVCSPGGSLLFTLKEVDFSVFSDSSRTSAGANGASWPSSLLKRSPNHRNQHPREESVEWFCTVTRHGTLVCTLESRVPPPEPASSEHRTPAARAAWGGHPALAA